MANLGLKRLLHHFSNDFSRLLKTTPLPQLQTSSSFFIVVVLQKRLLSSTHSLPVSALKSSSSSSSSFAVNYLTNSCGIPLKDALSASKKFQLKENKSHQHQYVLDLLRSFQFSDTHIKKLLIKYPRILQSNVHGNLEPKLQFLTYYGFVGPLLPELIVANPHILRKSLSDFIKPTFEFLGKYIRTPDKVVLAAKRSPRLITSNLNRDLQPNVDFLLSEGVTPTTIEKHIVRQPRTLMMKLHKIGKAVETFKDMGLKPSAPMFLEAIRVKLSLSHSTWERKMQMFKSFGWSKEEIIYALLRNPVVLSSSEEKIRSLMDFYLNTVNLNPAVISSYPILLNFRLSTRIRPRYNVMKVLKSKELLKEDRKYHWLFNISEKKFMTGIVDKHLDKVPNLMKLYRGTITVDKIDIQPH
ncbi:hypothetical protein LguiB_024073 [Lonicera macranthoides]